MKIIRFINKIIKYIYNIALLYILCILFIDISIYTFNTFVSTKTLYNAYTSFSHNKYRSAYDLVNQIIHNQRIFGQQLIDYGNAFYHMAFTDNISIKKRTHALILSSKLYEQSLYAYPSAFTYEKLGFIYIYLSKDVAFEHVKTIPEFQDQTQLSFINQGIEYLNTSSMIIPWRLTPKYYLAQVYHQFGDTNNAIQWAQLVINTPMKVWSKDGETFKLQAQEMLHSYGVACDDPGLIVFDINDRQTWNEGKW